MLDLLLFYRMHHPQANPQTSHVKPYTLFPDTSNASCRPPAWRNITPFETIAPLQRQPSPSLHRSQKLQLTCEAVHTVC
jgi:hypothetical protein